MRMRMNLKLNSNKTEFFVVVVVLVILNSDGFACQSYLMIQYLMLVREDSIDLMCVQLHIKHPHNCYL